MRMTWRDLLFMHWPVEPAPLARLLPAGLDVETFDGSAWLGVVPLTMAGVRARFLPPCPGAAAFLELNVRTYVVPGRSFPEPQRVPGVWFFSLDAASRSAVEVARRTYRLNYLRARMSQRREGGRIAFVSARIDSRAGPAGLDVRFAPAPGEPAPTRAGTLERFLTARFCLYAADPRGRLRRAHVHHPPWRLRPADVEVRANSMLPLDGADPLRPALSWLADTLDVVAWRPDRVRGDGA
jgi:uncharacterized protein YqjF (DUF2071 family)